MKVAVLYVSWCSFVLTGNVDATYTLVFSCHRHQKSCDFAITTPITTCINMYKILIIELALLVTVSELMLAKLFISGTSVIEVIIKG